jgi:nitroimidazol reductase NimA-like FMN-containing flavoprotein (pyridoxamine 5'-phosphate oxidase superfamily)
LSVGVRRWGGRRLERDEIETLLEEAKIARVCCHNQDGTIHSTPTWFRYEDDTIRIPIPSDSRKARNIKRNENVTILVDVVKPPKGVMVYGKALLDDVDVMSKAIRVNEKYQTNEEAKTTIEKFLKETDYILTVKTERIASFHY